MRVLLALAFLLLISMCSADNSPFEPFKQAAINAKNARPAGFNSKDFNVWSSLGSSEQRAVNAEVNPLLESMDTSPINPDNTVGNNKITRAEAELVHSNIDGFDEIDLLGKDDPNDVGNDWLALKELRLAAVAKLIEDNHPEFMEADLQGKIRRRRKL